MGNPKAFFAAKNSWCWCRIFCSWYYSHIGLERALFDGVCTEALPVELMVGGAGRHCKALWFTVTHVTDCRPNHQHRPRTSEPHHINSAQGGYKKCTRWYSMPLFRITLVQCLNASQCIRATKGYQVMQCSTWVVEVTVPWVHQFWIYHGTEERSSANWVHRWQLLVEPEGPAIMGGDSNQDGVRLTLLPLVAPVLVSRRHFVVTVVQGCTWQVQRCTWQLLLHLNRLPSYSTLSEQDLHTRRISDACIARHWIKLESWIFVGAQPLLSQPWETTEFLLWIKLYNPHLHPCNPS